MANPPTYEESVSACGYQSDSKSDSKAPRRFCIREEVDVSRLQHVSALVSKLLPQVRERARRGLSKTALLLLPSNQEHGQRGELVGFPEGEVPTIVQLEGNVDTVEFWMQQGAVDQLRSQMLAAVSQGPGSPADESPLPTKVACAKPSFFGRKQGKMQEHPSGHASRNPSVKASAEFDEAYFRAENEYGLYETHRAKCVLLVIEVG